MKAKVFKYPFAIEPRIEIEMPAYARIVHCGIQVSRHPRKPACELFTPTLWVTVDPTSIPKARVFRCVMTGEEFDYVAGVYYLATLQFPDGLVTHVFEDSRDDA